MIIYNESILSDFSSVAMASSINGPTKDLQNKRLSSISITWTGSPVGTFVLQLSNEVSLSGASGVTSASFDDISGSSLSVSAAGQQTWNFTGEYYARYFRVKWTATSGSGTITACNISYKQGEN